MKTTEMLSKIKALLNANTNLAQQTLDNGTVIEAESFETWLQIFRSSFNSHEPVEGARQGDQVYHGEFLQISQR